MQTQVPLYEVLGGHVMLPILHHAGILQRRHTNVDVDLGSTAKQQRAHWNKSVRNEDIYFALKSRITESFTT